MVYLPNMHKRSLPVSTADFKDEEEMVIRIITAGSQQVLMLIPLAVEEDVVNVQKRIGLWFVWLDDS